MTVHPFPLCRVRATPGGVVDFPVVPRGTVLLPRRPAHPADFAAGNLAQTYPPRVGKVALLLADTAAEQARDRLAALRAREAAREAERQAPPRWGRLRRGIAWAGSPAPTVVAVLTGAAAFGMVAGLLFGVATP